MRTSQEIMDEALEMFKRINPMQEGKEFTYGQTDLLRLCVHTIMFEEEMLQRERKNCQPLNK